MRVIELGVMAILALVVLMLGVRPLVRRITGSPAMLANAPTPAALPPASAAALAGSGAAGSTTVSIVGSDQDVAISNRTSTMIDIAKVQGQVHAESVKKVGELADMNPSEAVAIVRSWLHEQAA